MAMTPTGKMQRMRFIVEYYSGDDDSDGSKQLRILHYRCELVT